jgi:hypothetical protein
LLTYWQQISQRFVLPPSASTPHEVLLAAVAAAIAGILLFHGYEIFNFTLSIDEEVNLAGEDLYANIQQGRWGQALRILLLLPDTTAPVVSVGIGLALYGAAFVLLIRQLGIRHWASVAVAAPIFFGFPTLVQTIAFADLALALGIGALFIVLALRSAETLSGFGIGLATILVALAVSLYQSLLFLAIVVFVADLVRRSCSRIQLDRDALQRMAIYAGIILAGVLLYAVVNALLLKALDLQLIYVDQFANPELLGIAALRATIAEAASLYSGDSSTFLHLNGYYQILIASSGIALVLGTCSLARSSPRMALVIALLLIAILLAPFLQHPLAGGKLPYRTLLALPVAVGLMALFAAETSPIRFRNWLLVPLAALVAIQFAWISNRQYYAGHWALERDKAVAAEIVSRIQAFHPGKRNYLIAVIGKLEPVPSPLARFVTYSTVGASFFEWDGGNAARIAGLLNLLSETKFAMPHPVLYRQAFEAAVTMPSWPADGSIAPMGNVMIVKLSEPTRPQLERLCSGETTGICANIQR